MKRIGLPLLLLILFLLPVAGNNSRDKEWQRLNAQALQLYKEG